MTTMTLSDRIWQTEGMMGLAKKFLMATIGVMALAISARTQITSVPVPVTLQVLVVMSIGAAYGSRMAFITIVSYLALGAAGYPVFAGTPEKGIGLAYMLGATGGYLLGFLIAATLVGWLAERGWDRNPMTMFTAMGIGLLALYIPGVTWLSAGFSLLPFSGEFQGYGWANWYAYGVKTFLWIDAVKLMIAVVAFPTIWKWLGETR